MKEIKLDHSLENKTVFIGIGAQKAGTTWLNDTLLKYENVATPHIKELHYFDVKWLDKDINPVVIYKSRAKELQKISEKVSQVIQDKCNTLMLEENQRTDSKDKKRIFDDSYLSSFKLKNKCERIIDLANVLSIKNDRDYIDYLAKIGLYKDIVGEISPSYSLLPIESFSHIKTLIPHAKIIFLMRDPIDRFISQLKFKGKRHASRGLKEYDVLGNFEKMLNEETFISRSDYEVVIEKIQKIFNPDYILILFYEKLLDENTVGEYRKIESYLGLKEKEEDEILSWKDVRLNETKKIEIPDMLKRKAGVKFKGVYDYIFEHFEEVPQRWRNNYEKFCI